jgi:hypothetical protein
MASREEIGIVRWKGEDKTIATVQQHLGSDSGDKGKITTVGVQGKYSLHASSSSNNESHNDEQKMNELFHIRVVSKHTKIDTLFDLGSQVNLIYESLVKKMGLETKPHLKPYPLGWVCDKQKLNVTKQCRVRFSIASKLINEVDLDVVPLDMCGIVLGSHYLYDRKAVFFRHEKKYHLTKGGVEYIVRAHSMRVNTTLVSASPMKRLINTNKKYVLMVVREKDVGTSDAFQGCDPSHKKKLVDIVSKYDDIFQEPNVLPPKREIQHEIHLQQDSPLPNLGMYRMSVVVMTEIKKVQGLLDQGVIRPSSPPCGSLIMIVPKKDGTWIMCVDYRALNKITVKNQYPLPHIDYLLDQLKNVVCFTKLDFHTGYHQIRVAEQDAWKISFKTKQGLFKWLVMSFGICNAPTNFMRVMNDVFRPFLDDFVIVYLDDIIIFSGTWDEHVRRVNQVLDTLQREKLYVKLSKCEIGKIVLVFLGHIVGGGQLKNDPSKIDVIVNWPKTKSVTEIQIFLGAVQYWRRFISNLFFIVSHLHALTSVKNTFQ